MLATAKSGSLLKEWGDMTFGDVSDFEGILAVLQALEDETNTSFGKI